VIQAPDKHPSSQKWYYLKWSATELQNATIASAVWTVPSGITKLDQSINGMLTGIKLSGGTLDAEYQITVAITTSFPEVLYETLSIKISASGH